MHQCTCWSCDLCRPWRSLQHDFSEKTRLSTKGVAEICMTSGGTAPVSGLGSAQSSGSGQGKFSKTASGILQASPFEFCQHFDFGHPTTNIRLSAGVMAHFAAPFQAQSGIHLTGRRPPVSVNSCRCTKFGGAGRPRCKAVVAHKGTTVRCHEVPNTLQECTYGLACQHRKLRRGKANARITHGKVLALCIQPEPRARVMDTAHTYSSVQEFCNTPLMPSCNRFLHEHR